MRGEFEGESFLSEAVWGTLILEVGVFHLKLFGAGGRCYGGAGVGSILADHSARLLSTCGSDQAINMWFPR